jgi:16S rRNA (adenine1518-N6/adenine1519-N6)-dimethyltransferase
MPTTSLFEPLSLHQTKTILQSLAQSPQKKWGQNFLVDKNIVAKSIQFAQLKSGENVIEIGPGLGTLTRPILALSCSLFAIECDPTFYQFLHNTFSHLSHFHILLGDAVAQPLAGYANLDGSFKIVANLPYNISTPWFDAVLSQPQLPLSMTLMLQRETAARLFAQPGSKKYSAISISLHSTYTCTATFPVARSSFLPTPKVDSVLVQLDRLPSPKILHPYSKSLIRKIFTQRRKQIGTLFRTFSPKISLPLPELLQRYDSSISSRPEQLPLLFWHDLDHFIRSTMINDFLQELN